MSFVNGLHQKFMIEGLANNQIPFLDMMISLQNGQLSTAWYSKPTDTGILMNFRSVAPTKYKVNIIQGTLHRIFNATSTWEAFHEGVLRACSIFEQNQYPPVFYQPIVRKTIQNFSRS